MLTADFCNLLGEEGENRCREDGAIRVESVTLSDQTGYRTKFQRRIGPDGATTGRPYRPIRV